MVIKRSAAEEADLNSALRVQGKKGIVSLADVTARLKQRNLEMAAHLKSVGVELPEYYANIDVKQKRGVR